METARLNGIEISYVRRGTGGPLVLIHGYPLDHTIWEPVAVALEAHFDLVIPDLRGFGNSSVVDATYSMDDMAADVAGLLDHLGIRNAFIVGHSMGGYVALAFLRNFDMRTLGLGLVSSQAAADPPDRKEGRYKTAAEAAANGIGGVIDAMAPKLTASPGLQEQLRRLMGRQPAGGVVGALKAMAERNDLLQLLAGSKVPLLLLHGEADALVPIERAREVKQAAPRARLVELPGVGHMPMLENPGATATAIQSLA